MNKKRFSPYLIIFSSELILLNFQSVKQKNLTQDTAQMKIQEEQEEVYEEAVAELGK